VELGLISRESYERNRGTYVHRVYEKHEADDGRFAQWATGLGHSHRRKIIGDQFKGRGMFQQVKPDTIFKDNAEFLGAKRGKPQKGDKIIILDRRTTDGTDALPGIKGPKGKLARRVYWPADVAIPEKFKDYDNRGTFEVRGISQKGKVTLWCDFSKAERLKMGEIMDARYTVAKIFALMAEDLATGRFFKDIAENVEWSRKKPPEGAITDDDPRLPDRLAIIATEVRNCFEVWRKAAGQPQHLDVATCLQLQPAARLNAIEISVNINLQQYRRMVTGPFCHCSVTETDSDQIK
jgi:hypothetical protein